MVAPISARIVVDSGSFGGLSVSGQRQDPESTTKKTNQLLRLLLKLTGQQFLLAKGGLIKQIAKLTAKSTALALTAPLLGAIALDRTVSEKTGTSPLDIIFGDAREGFGGDSEIIQKIKDGFEYFKNLVGLSTDKEEDVIEELGKLEEETGKIVDITSEGNRIIKELPAHLKANLDAIDNSTNAWNNFRPPITGIGGTGRKHFGGRATGVPIPDVSNPEVIAWNAEFGGPGGVQIGDSEYTDWIVIDVGDS